MARAGDAACGGAMGLADGLQEELVNCRLGQEMSGVSIALTVVKGRGLRPYKVRCLTLLRAIVAVGCINLPLQQYWLFYFKYL